MMDGARVETAGCAPQSPAWSPFRHAPAMIQTMDPDGRLLSVNLRWLDALGYADTEVVGRPFGSLLAAADAARVQAAIAVLPTSDPPSVEPITVTVNRRDGGTARMTLSLALDRRPGGVPHIIGFLVDDGDDAESRVRRRDTWLRAILENAPVEIVLKDRELRFLAVSRNIALARGADMDSVLGRRTIDFFPPEIASIYEAADRQVIETGAAIQQEVKEVEDGGTRYIHNAKFPLRDGTGYIIGVCSLSMETTEIRRMEEQLFQAQKMEAVGKLTGGIAHDFNNLLMVISGNLDLIAGRQGRESPEIQAALRAIERGADLTRRLLAFSRRQFLQPQPVALGELIEEIRELIQRTMGQSIELEAFVPDDLPTVMADPGQLHNAILNLALNARDAMPQGGTLTISAAKVWLGETLGGVQTDAAPGEYVRLSVADTGTGIDPAILEKVFEPFFTTKGVGQGSGLGLSMVYGFIKQSGGHITIDSAPGQGTTVALFLPLAGREAGAADAGRPPTDGLPPGRGETVLFVEDDVDIRTMAGTTLRDLGYKVTTAADPGAALAAHGAAGRFDLLVTDVLLGAGARGTDLARWLVDRQPDLKVVFITGYAGADQGELTPPAGGQLLTKPYTREVLAGTLRNLLDA